MKKQILKALGAMSLAALVFTGCKKYEEGPAFSLASKKSRLAGEWKMEKIFLNGTDMTSMFITSDDILHIEKDGKYHTHDSNSSSDGTWKFSDNKEELIMQESTAGSTEEKMTIVKLKSKELWLKATESGSSDVWELHYKQ